MYFGPTAYLAFDSVLGCSATAQKYVWFFVFRGNPVWKWVFLGEEKKFSGTSPNLRPLCFCAYAYTHNRLQHGDSFSQEAASMSALCEELLAHVLGALQFCL